MKNSLLVQKYKDEKIWVNYRIVTRTGKKTKLPFQTNGRMADSTEPSTWATFDEVYQKDQERIGIVFPDTKLILGIDIDHCLNPETKGIDHELQQIIAALIIESDTYTEISPSGEGLHFIFQLTEPLDLVANRKEPFEAYTSDRYFTVTGNSYGEEREVRTITPEVALELLAIINYPWGKKKKESIEIGVNDIADTLDDETVLFKMFAGKKNGAEIKALYNGDTSKYKDNKSVADAGLLAHLAFWTQKNPVQMERLWMASPLGAREKTQERKDYRAGSIANAIANTTAVYTNAAIQLEEEHPELDLLFTVNSKKDKVFTLCTENITRVLRDHDYFKGRFRFDIFKNKMEVQKAGVWREM